MISISGGHQNWWTFNLDIDQPQLKYWLDLAPVSPQCLDFQAAADYTAQCISSQYSNIHLAMSGGLDSEFVANVFHRNSIKFVPVVGLVKGSKNLDFQYALDWCDRHSTTPVILEFEYNDQRFIQQAAVVAKKYRIKRERMPMLMSILDYICSVGGHYVTGDPSMGYTDLDENFYKPIGNNFELWASEFLPSVHHANQPGGFLFYTPELVWAHARTLDTNLNDSRSRAKLYGLNFRPKTWPPEQLSKEHWGKISNVTELDKYSQPSHYGWTKEDLLNIFLAACPASSRYTNSAAYATMT